MKIEFWQNYVDSRHGGVKEGTSMYVYVHLILAHVYEFSLLILQCYLACGILAIRTLLCELYGELTKDWTWEENYFIALDLEKM